MIIAVDTGGTKTLITSFDQHGEPIEIAKFPTPREPKEYLRQLIDILSPYANTRLRAIVIAVPGIVENNIAIHCPNLGWKNFAIVNNLKKNFNDIPILIENDANLGGLGEARIRKNIPHSLLYITVSTGIGTGAITDGHIDPGMRLSEGGHILLEYRGKLQQWESFASGRSIVRVYKKFARDLFAKYAWRQIAKNISRGLLALLPFMQPEVVVIGGSIGTHFDKYETRLKQIIAHSLPANIRQPKIIKAKHPEYAVIYGCYYYAFDYFAARH